MRGRVPAVAALGATGLVGGGLRRTGRGLTGAAVAAVLGWAGPAVADAVVEQIDRAKAYYAEGDLAAAAAELDFAVQAIRGRLADRYLATLAEAPPGWTAGEPSRHAAPAALLGGGTVITREYLQEGGSGRMTATLMADSPMLQGLIALVGSPALLAMQPGARRVRVEREDAILTYDATARTGEITMVVGAKVVIKVEGSGVAGSEPLEALLRGFRLAEIRRLSGS